MFIKMTGFKQSNGTSNVYNYEPFDPNKILNPVYDYTHDNVVFGYQDSVEALPQNAIEITQDQYNSYVTQFANSVPLDEVKKQKIASLHQSLQNSISTFQSSVLGTTYTYLSDDKSMAFLNSQYSLLTGPHAPSGYTRNWFTVEGGWINHTSDQIIQLFLDGNNAIGSQYDKFTNLESQVNATTTNDQVNAIQW